MSPRNGFKMDSMKFGDMFGYLDQTNDDGEDIKQKEKSTLKIFRNKILDTMKNHNAEMTKEQILIDIKKLNLNKRK